ncbi:MAG: hypothetical protein CM1200mP1_13790 [Candidatus Neomarinimicrobiota bacterium]|nr:MAG: hypothetical protein CM1200mP1_13790 [Candidatus Neomarinimicrobiota bacterium]
MQSHLLEKKKKTFLNYAQSTLTDIFGNSLETSPYLEANTLESVVLINNGDLFFHLILSPSKHKYLLQCMPG